MRGKISLSEFNRLFDYILNLWPTLIDVSDQHHFPNGGMRIPALTEAHERVEDKLEEVFQGMDFSKASAIEFSLFTVLHMKIRKEGLKVLTTKRVDVNSVMDTINSYENWCITD